MRLRTYLLSQVYQPSLSTNVTPKGKPYPSIMQSSMNAEVCRSNSPKQKIPTFKLCKNSLWQGLVAIVQMRPTQIDQKTKKWIVSLFPCNASRCC